MPEGPPYTAGDVLTCSSNGYPAPTYYWTLDGDPGSTTNIQALQEGDHKYVCTATVTFDNGEMCSDNATVTATGYSKYQKNIVRLCYRCYVHSQKLREHKHFIYIYVHSQNDMVASLTRTGCHLPIKLLNVPPHRPTQGGLKLTGQSAV